MTSPLIDAIFPEEYQPVMPVKVTTKSGLAVTPYANSLDNVVRNGLNQMTRQFTVRYELPIDDANYVDSFLSYASAYDGSFFWRAGNFTAYETRVRCEQWTKDFVAHDWGVINATFIETFDFAARRRGIESDRPMTYSLSFVDSSLYRGKYMTGETAGYQFSPQDIDFIKGYYLTGDPASYGLEIIKAGPEFYDPLIAETVSYITEFQDVGGVVSTGFPGSDLVQYYEWDAFVYDETSGMWIEWQPPIPASSEYFGDMSVQMFSWESLAYIEWWGN